MFRRREVEGFRMGHVQNLRFSSCVFILTRDGGLLGLDVTAQLNLLPTGGRREERNLEQLRNWLTGAA